MPTSQLTRFIPANTHGFIDSFFLGKVPNAKYHKDPEITGKQAINLLLLLNLQFSLSVRNAIRYKTGWGLRQFSRHERTRKEEVL